jgi:pimeloyl-ACP methyl ester carboxylesterase
MLGGGIRLLERGRDAVVGVDLRASNDYQGAMAAAARLRCPVLFVLGDRDRMTPVKAARPLAEAIENARVEIIPHSGHMMMVEQPDLTLDALRTIL